MKQSMFPVQEVAERDGVVSVGVGPLGVATGAAVEAAVEADDVFTVGRHRFASRLLLGTGKYRDFEQTRDAVEASGTQIVTVAIRRTNIGQDAGEPSLLDVLPPSRYTILPNTAGCYNADDAVRTLRLARELLSDDTVDHTLVKLEVLGDSQTLFPNMPETLKAAETLVREGFEVMVYCSDDPIQARLLEEIGCVAVMPLASLIGSGMGILNPWNLRLILDRATVPVVVDAGVGTASDAAIAMEMGCAGVLMNTAVAAARDPVLMAAAMKRGVEAGRMAYRAGRMPKKLYAATPSSPTGGRDRVEGLSDEATGKAGVGAAAGSASATGPDAKSATGVLSAVSVVPPEPATQDPSDVGLHHRRIRSFVTRAGRTSPAQQRARDTLGERFVVPFGDAPLDWLAMFGRTAPVVLEIGFGMGAATAEVADAHRDLDFIGVEVHTPGVGALLKMIGERVLTNVRIVEHDAVEVLETMIAPASLDGVLVWFPDPWHKARHNKRRLLQPAFVATLASRLKPGGLLHCATDWEEYAVQMLEVLGADASLANVDRGGGYASATTPLLRRPVTKFETRGKRLGHGVWDVVFAKRAATAS